MPICAKKIRFSRSAVEAACWHKEGYSFGSPNPAVWLHSPKICPYYIAHWGGMEGLSYTDLRRQRLIDMIDGLPPGLSIWAGWSYVAAAFGADRLSEVNEAALQHLAGECGCDCRRRPGDVKFTKRRPAPTR